MEGSYTRTCMYTVSIVCTLKLRLCIMLWLPQPGSISQPTPLCLALIIDVHHDTYAYVYI